MEIKTSPVLPDILIVEPRIFEDQRGYFLETYHLTRYNAHNIPTFVQDNLSFSRMGTLRGLHYQLGKPQGKLVWVAQGEIFDVAVDIRRGSPGFGKWVGMTLSSSNHKQVYIPEGFAHGFCVTSQSAIVMYKCTALYAPEEERGIRWDDPMLDVQWPISSPVLSEKDAIFPAMRDVDDSELPCYTPLKK